MFVAKRCPEEREAFKANGLPVEPTFEENKCKFVPKQCNDEKCFCVKRKTGQQRYRKVEIPLRNAFDCSSKILFVSYIATSCVKQ